MDNVINSSTSQTDNDLEKQVSDVINTKTESQEDISIAILPDTFNESNRLLYSNIFSRLRESQKTHQVLNIVLVTEAITSEYKDTVFIPEDTSVFFKNSKNFADTIQIVKDSYDAIQAHDETFEQKFGNVLPFLKVLYPDIPIFPIVTSKVKSGKIRKIVREAILDKATLTIFIANLSMGVNHIESSNKDPVMVSALLTQEKTITTSDTPYAEILNAASKISLKSRLRPRIYKYLQTGMTGRDLVRVKGMVAVGYSI